MIYLKYFLFAILSLVANIFAWLLCPFMAALSVITNKDTSPWPLSLLHTADDTLDGGQHQEGWPKVKGWKLFLQRMRWIARNPAGGADNLMGIPRGPETQIIVVTDKSAVHHKGFKQVHKLIYKGQTYFSYRTNFVWFGWNPYGPRADTHIFKFSLRTDLEE